MLALPLPCGAGSRLPSLLTPGEVEVLFRTSRKAIYAMIDGASCPAWSGLAAASWSGRMTARLAAPEVHAIAGKSGAMSVTVRPYRRGGWEVDIIARLPDGSRYRDRSGYRLRRSQRLNDGVRIVSGICSQHGPPQTQEGGATLEEFAPRFMDGHARANRQKPSGIAAKETI